MPVISATPEAETGESLEPGMLGLWWAETVPLHYSLGNKSETPSQKKKKERKKITYMSINRKMVKNYVVKPWYIISLYHSLCSSVYLKYLPFWKWPGRVSIDNIWKIKLFQIFQIHELCLKNEERNHYMINSQTPWRHQNEWSVRNRSH